MDDKEICRILDEMRADEPDHENCAMKDRLYKDLENKIKSMKKDTVTAVKREDNNGN